MPVIQPSYTANLLPAYEGMLGDSRDHTIISMTVQSAAGIGFGKAAYQGTLADTCINAADANDTTGLLRGFTEASHFASEGLADLWARYETIPVVKKGPIWLLANVAVAAGELAYVVLASGLVTNVLTSNVPIGRFESGGAGGALVLVDLDIM
jgi:hypothetical protein